MRKKKKNKSTSLSESYKDAIIQKNINQLWRWDTLNDVSLQKLEKNEERIFKVGRPSNQSE